MENLTAEMRFIKDRMKEVWSAGNFGEIAKIIEHEGHAFIERLNITPHSTVLDVACGTGNLAIPAARLGARVTGIDIVPALIEQANEKARSESLEINFEVGDAEALPYGNNEFDFVVTMFGAMFCPRPDVAASELFRVCKPGGVVAMANWTPEGFIGSFFKLGSSYMPPPPGIRPPVEWGVENIVLERINDKASHLQMERRMLRQRMPMSAVEVVDYFIKYFGPTNKLYELLNDKYKSDLKNKLFKLFSEHNLSKTGTVEIDAEFLEIHAVKK